MNAKFKSGDVLQRISSRNYKTASMREEIKILDFSEDEQIYVTENTWDKVRHFGLKTIIEDCFEKVC